MCCSFFEEYQLQASMPVSFVISHGCTVCYSKTAQKRPENKGTIIHLCPSRLVNRRKRLHAAAHFLHIFSPQRTKDTYLISKGLNTSLYMYYCG